MSTCTKIAVTVPTATYEALERVRRRLGKSRSAAVALALQAWLRGLEVGDADRRYIEAYLRQPERADKARAIAAQSIARWEPWGKAGPRTRGSRGAHRRPRRRSKRQSSRSAR